MAAPVALAPRQIPLPSACRCSQDCMVPFQSGVLKEARCLWEAEKFALGRDECNEFLYQLLRALQGLGGGGGQIQWQFLGQKVCREVWRELAGIGNARLSRLLTALKAAVFPFSWAPGERGEGPTEPTDSPGCGYGH